MSEKRRDNRGRILHNGEIQLSYGRYMTVLELVEKYTSTKNGVRPTTVAGYGTVINLLKKDPFGKRRIYTVRISDAKCWLIHFQQVEKL